MLYLIVTDLYGFRQSYQCDTPQELAQLARDFVRAGLRVMVHEAGKLGIDNLGDLV